jgi:hypothetical protein
MTDTKQTESASGEGFGAPDKKICGGYFKKMFQMMQKFCRSESCDFDCAAVMKKMCGDATLESHHK